MFEKLRRSALLVALILATTAPVAAQDVIIDLDRDGPRLRLEDDDDRIYRRDRNRRDCGPERALNKAERIGVRRARVVRVGRRTIDIRGRLDGERVVVTIGRSRGCPVLSY